MFRIIIAIALITSSCNNNSNQETLINTGDTSITWVHFPIWDEDGHVYQYKREYDHIPTLKDSMEFRNFILREIEKQVAISQQLKKEKPVKVTPDTGLSNNEGSGTFILREGSHQFTLHTISWDQPGKVQIKQIKDNNYSVKGGQKSQVNNDYISIEGILKVISAVELEFDGTIKSFVENTHEQPCTKTGKQIFLSTKNRQYWRMQDMRLCDYGYADYVDIYFK